MKNTGILGEIILSITHFPESTREDKVRSLLILIMTPILTVALLYNMISATRFNYRIIWFILSIFMIEPYFVGVKSTSWHLTQLDNITIYKNRIRFPRTSFLDILFWSPNELYYKDIRSLIIKTDEKLVRFEFDDLKPIIVGRETFPNIQQIIEELRTIFTDLHIEIIIGTSLNNRVA